MHPGQRAHSQCQALYVEDCNGRLLDDNDCFILLSTGNAGGGHQRTESSGCKEEGTETDGRQCKCVSLNLSYKSMNVRQHCDLRTLRASGAGKY